MRRKRKKVNDIAHASGARRKQLPSGFDSKLEMELSKKMTKCDWKPDTIDYIVEKKYHPDAQYGMTIIEIKGRFRTSEEAKKYLWVRDKLPEGYDLVFVFSNPNCPMPRARRRKNGSIRTHAMWAEHHGFTWYSKKDLPKEWN